MKKKQTSKMKHLKKIKTMEIQPVCLIKYRRFGDGEEGGEGDPASPGLPISPVRLFFQRILEGCCSCLRRPKQPKVVLIKYNLLSESAQLLANNCGVSQTVAPVREAETSASCKEQDGDVLNLADAMPQVIEAVHYSNKGERETSFGSTNVETCSESINVETCSESTNVETSFASTNGETCSESPNVETCPESPNAETCSESTNVETCSESPNVETCSESPNVETCSESPNVETCSESTNVETCSASANVVTSSGMKWNGRSSLFQFQSPIIVDVLWKENQGAEKINHDITYSEPVNRTEEANKYETDDEVHKMSSARKRRRRRRAVAASVVAPTPAPAPAPEPAAAAGAAKGLKTDSQGGGSCRRAFPDAATASPCG